MTYLLDCVGKFSYHIIPTKASTFILKSPTSSCFTKTKIDNTHGVCLHGTKTTAQ